MEILLLQDIPGIGKKNDVLVVGDGYALNKLLPSRAALVATPTVRKRYSEQIRRRAEERAIEMKSQRQAAQELSGKKLTFARKATKTGKLYAAISEKHLADALKDQLKIEANEDAISIPEPIKALGIFSVNVKLAGADQKLDVEVVQEK